MKKIMIAFAWTVCVLTACDKNKPSQTEMQALPVDVAKPLVENVTLTKDYPGYLEAESTVDLVGRVNGTLQSKNFAPGSRVRQGQVLFVIEPTLYENSVKQAEAELKTAKANLEYAVSSYQRMKEAIKSDAVSRIQYLQAESHVVAMSRLLVTEWLMFRLILSGRILVVLCNRLNWLLFIRITVCIPILILQITNI